ncbi:MAG TPA: ABC transporter permease [Candidatus Methylomirabilis sp.]|nr:ABC transporter permease [Candidatus Methylomirabilis sp.]
MGVWIMAGVTFREASRRKIAWAALLAGVAFLALFATGMHLQAKDLVRYKVPPFVRYQVQSSILQVGFYAVDVLAILLAILTSVDTLSGEIASGTIHAIATKPVSRWEIVVGKWIGFACMVAVYVALMFAGVATVGRVIAGIATPRVFLGGTLVYLECLLVLTLTFACGTSFSTLTNGVIVIGLHGLAFIGGWIEQIAAITNSPHLVTVGIVSSLLMPSEALWHRASFEMQSSFARTLQFTPFSNASTPSMAMIGYAAAYIAIAFGVAIYSFRERDL